MQPPERTSVDEIITLTELALVKNVRDVFDIASASGVPLNLDIRLGYNITAVFLTLDKAQQAKLKERYSKRGLTLKVEYEYANVVNDDNEDMLVQTVKKVYVEVENLIDGIRSLVFAHADSICRSFTCGSPKLHRRVAVASSPLLAFACNTSFWNSDLYATASVYKFGTIRKPVCEMYKTFADQGFHVTMKIVRDATGEYVEITCCDHVVQRAPKLSYSAPPYVPQQVAPPPYIPPQVLGHAHDVPVYAQQPIPRLRYVEPLVPAPPPLNPPPFFPLQAQATLVGYPHPQSFTVHGF